MRGQGLQTLVNKALPYVSHWSVCPYCGKTLSKAEYGIRSHLTRHVRSGELAKDKLIEVTNRLSGRSEMVLKL